MNDNDISKKSTLQRFLEMDSSSSILLMVASIIAMICANMGSTAAGYQAFLHSKITLGFGDFSLSKPVDHWINDGLMVIFFFFVGMGIKRELKEGQLASRQDAILPLIAAIGGVTVPAIIFTWFNAGNDAALRGWAIPTATDIAFAVGVISLLGSRVPLGLKVFLTAVAVIDDLIAVLIIAFFYTANISIDALLVSAGCAILLLFMNMRGVRFFSLYLLVGVVMWLAIMKSGVHATIAGVVLGFAIPLKPDLRGGSMLKNIEHKIAYPVNHLILPLFAFANAGVVLAGVGLHQLQGAIPLGVACGLFFGKQIGVFSSSLIAIKLGVASRPKGSTWLQFYAVCLMCGIGFTMSLFVGTLAYDDVMLLTETKLGVMIGSIASGLVSYFLLKYALKISSQV